MPTGTRRSHNKTRLGCANCKKRRIKCDCTHPICDHCSKRGQECSFLLLAPSSTLSTVSRSTAPSTTPSSGSPSASDETNFTSPSDSRTTYSESEDFEIIERAPSSLFTISHPQSTVTLADLELPFLSTIPPSLHSDVWKDVRESLSPGLRGLLYHYEYTTSLTLAGGDDPAKAAWACGVPQLASQHQFLIHHIIAVASLHLGRLHGSSAERWTMTNVAASQMNKALAKYRPALENICAENASALFASATLTAVYFFRTSTVDIDEIRASVPKGTVEPSQEVVDRMLRCVLSTIWGLRGPLAVLIPGFQYVMQGQMSPVLHRSWPNFRVPTTPKAMKEDTRLSRIEQLWDFRTNPGVPSIDTLASALFYLREAYFLVATLAEPNTEYPSNTSIGYSLDGKTEGQLKDRGAIFFWATRISRDFIRLVAEQNREALVILAHYAVLPGRARNAWWLEGLGPNMLTAVAVALGRDNWHLIKWPVKVLKVDLENLFTTRTDRLEGSVDEVAMEIV